MIGQQQGGALGDFQVVGGDGHTGGHNAAHLLPQSLTVQGHAVAEDIDHALAEDAGGQQVQAEFAVLVDDGVTGVAAALITDDNIIVLGYQIDHAALALVAPVDAYNRTIRHSVFLQYLPEILKFRMLQCRSGHK